MTRCAAETLTRRLWARVAESELRCGQASAGQFVLPDRGQGRALGIVVGATRRRVARLHGPVGVTSARCDADRGVAW